MIAGAAEFPGGPFIAGSLAARALKYVPMAALAYVFGPAVHRALRRYGRFAIVVVAALLVYLLRG